MLDIVDNHRLSPQRASQVERRLYSRRMKLLNEVSALNGLLYEEKKKLCRSIFGEVVHDSDKEKNNLSVCVVNSRRKDRLEK